MPTIHIILCSQAHNDPAPWDLALKQITDLRSAGHKVVVGEELSISRTGEESYQIAVDHLKYIRDIRKLAKLIEAKEGKLSDTDKHKFFSTCERLDYFLINLETSCREIITNKIHLDLEDDYKTLNQKIKFYDLLRNSRPPIPIHALDLEKNYLEVLKRDEATETEFAMFEPKRMHHMSMKIIEALFPLVNTGGFMFVMNLGMIHTERLHFYLDRIFKNLPELNIHIESLRFFSRQAHLPKKLLDAYRDFEARNFSLSRLVDNSTMLDFYRKNPARVLSWLTDPAIDNFTCDEFHEIINNLISSMKQEALAPQCTPLMLCPTLLYHSAYSKMLLFDNGKEAKESHWFIKNKKFTVDMLRMDDKKRDESYEAPSAKPRSLLF